MAKLKRHAAAEKKRILNAAQHISNQLLTIPLLLLQM